MERNPSSLKESTSSGLSSSESIATSLASPESLSRMIEKRTSSWHHIHQSHSALSEPWFETALVSRSHVDRHLAKTLGSVKSTQKTRNLFVLGMSLGRILGVDDATELCRSLSRVLTEWELWNENGLSGRAPGVSDGVVSFQLAQHSPCSLLTRVDTEKLVSQPASGEKVQCLVRRHRQRA